MLLVPPGWVAAHAPVANAFAVLGSPLLWWAAAAVLLATALVLARRAPRWSLVLATLATLALGVSTNGLVDDAYIQFRYAANLASDKGMVFNPGERIEGASGGIWIAALAVGPLVGVDAGIWGRVLSLLLTALATAAAGVAVARIAGVRAGANAAILWASLPTTALYAATGLETSAYSLALWLAVASAGRDSRRGWLAGAGVSLLRPEGMVLGAATLPWIARMRRPLRTVVVGALAGAAAIAAARLLYFGAALPRSVTVKGFTAAAGMADGLAYLGRGTLEWWPLLLAGPVLWRYRRRLLPLLVGVGMWTALVAARGGDWMPGSRYLIPLLVLLAAVVAARTTDTVRWRVSAVLAAWGSFLLMPLPDPALVAPGRLWRAMETHRVQSAWWEGLGGYLRHVVPPDTTLATGPSGALPYASRLPAFDMYGLCSEVSQLSPTGQTGHRLWGLGAAAGRADVIYTGQMLPQDGNVRALLLAAEAQVAGVDRFRERYRPVALFHRPERHLDIVADVVWVSETLRLAGERSPAAEPDP